MKPLTLKLMEPCGGDYIYVRYRLVLEEMRDLGSTDWTARLLSVNPKQDEQDVISTAWHEALHVAVPWMREEGVLACEWNIRQVDAAIRRMLGIMDD